MTLFRITPFAVAFMFCSPLVYADGLLLTGVTDDLKENILAFTKLDDEDCNSPLWQVTRRFDDLDEKVAEALAPFGYYNHTLIKELEHSEDCWSAKVEVTLGDPVRFQNVDIQILGQGESSPQFQEVLSEQELRRGNVLSHQKYDQLKQRLRTVATDQGYFDAAFVESSLTVWPDQGVADVNVQFDTGVRYRIGPVSFEQDFLDPELVTKTLGDIEGDYYSTENLSKIQQSLNASSLFAGVQLTPQISARDNGKVPIRVVLTAAKRIAYTVGAGFSTDTGPRFRAGYDNRRLNRRGHQFDSDLAISSVLSELTSSYRRPTGRPDVEWTDYSAGIQVEETDTAESERLTLGVTRARLLKRDWLRTNSVRLQLDEFTVGTDRDNSRLLMPGVSFSKTRADDPTNPSRGYSATLEFRAAAQALGSSTTFAQFIGTTKWIRPVGEKGRLLFRGQVGTTIKTDFDELPPDIRFFAGGLESVRGYGFETLGSTDENDLVIGGSHIVTGSIEYDRLFYKDFAYAFFVDAGNAFDGSSIEARVGVGVGFKWRSPIGALRIYLAHPVNFETRSVRLHVSLGPDL